MFQDVIRQIIQSEIGEYAEQFECLEKELGELKRRLANLNKVGVISQLSQDKRRVKVKFGEEGNNETPFIKWLANSCGEDAEYLPPNVGEQVLLINIGAGDNSATSLAIRGIASDHYPLPSANTDEFHRKFPDGTEIKYNHKTHHLAVSVLNGSAVLNVPKGITLNTPNVFCTGNIKAQGEITDHTRSMKEDRDIYNKHTHLSPETSSPTSVTSDKQ